MTSSTLRLLSPVKVGPLHLAHRIVHAPMTRLRSGTDDSASAMRVEYYRQRSFEGGLLVTESAPPSFDSRGYIGAPGIYTDRHVEAWKKVTDVVRNFFNGPIIAAGGFDRDGAEQILQRGDADLVAFGRLFSSNPDLPQRFRHGNPLAHYRREAFWGGDERGYTDFPAFAA